MGLRGGRAEKWRFLLIPVWKRWTNISGMPPGDLPGASPAPVMPPADLPGASPTPVMPPGDLPGASPTPVMPPADLPGASLAPFMPPADLPGASHLVPKLQFGNALGRETLFPTGGVSPGRDGIRSPGATPPLRNAVAPASTCPNWSLGTRAESSRRRRARWRAANLSSPITPNAGTDRRGPSTALRPPFRLRSAQDDTVSKLSSKVVPQHASGRGSAAVSLPFQTIPAASCLAAGALLGLGMEARFKPPFPPSLPCGCGPPPSPGR